MAGVAPLPFKERPIWKPTRSMTYPLREPKGDVGKRRVKQGAPLDPEDLSRRLNAHLAEQKARTERRREARAAKAAAAAQQNGIYHHVPAVAATAFQRTATPDVQRQIHILAQPTAKGNVDAMHSEDSTHSGATTNLKKAQAMDHATIQKNHLLNRNQFQWTNDIERAHLVDLERDIYKPPQRTFQTSDVRNRHAPRRPRPLSTGDVFSSEEDAPVVVKRKSKAVFEPKDRHDWAQRDDEDNRQSRKDGIKLFLKKKESTLISCSI
ncbi:hypothetical protein BJ875DRAFT_186073 [Amylocarpus encephaloides]|uniref:Uncharacterized protein n=1 Tax=Amylocarpus encephaloides TaxID=45428 RepID=A0A9P8C164_9HELO|nr:hypothetical protein BJ875DRAFT_186073 [Amylocarpus encephaloides]